MAHVRKEEAKSKGERLQTILRLVQEHPISRQEVLLDYLRKEGFDVTQATISRDIRELCLVKAATAEGYRYVSSRNESFNPKTRAGLRRSFMSRCWGWTMQAMWCWSSAIPAWPMQPVRYLTHCSGKTWSAPFRVMTLF